MRLEDVPFVFKVHSLPNLNNGDRVLLSLEQFDLVDVELRAKYLSTLPPLEQGAEIVDEDGETEAEEAAELEPTVNAADSAAVIAEQPKEQDEAP